MRNSDKYRMLQETNDVLSQVCRRKLISFLAVDWKWFDPNHETLKVVPLIPDKAEISYSRTDNVEHT